VNDLKEGLKSRLNRVRLGATGFYNADDALTDREALARITELEDAREAAEAKVTDQAAEIERLRGVAERLELRALDEAFSREAAEAKLREAVDVMRNVCEAWEWWNVDTYDRCSGVPDDAVRSARAFLTTMEKPHGP
jgi:hypothetical protein